MERFLPTSETLRSATVDELEGMYDTTVEWANTQQNVGNSVNSAVTKARFVREELHRRSMESSGRRMERLTWVITALTAVNVVLVVIVALVAG